jgi:hypothetical protein
MLTRYAFFEGDLTPGQEAAFREAIRSELLPTWEVYPGAVAVRVSFGVERDAGAPSFPLVLAVDFPDRAALERALASQERLDSRAATQRVLPRFFTGRIHHHVTECL